MKFMNYTVKEFNKEFNTNLNGKDSLSEKCDQLEDKHDIRVFYADGEKDSVLGAIEDEKEIAKWLPLKFIHLDGDYLAIY